MNDPLRAELEAMREADQAFRREAMEIARVHGHHSPRHREILERGRETDQAHAHRLAEIVEEHGWPGVGLVGETGSRAAMLVLQHADLQMQKRFLPVVREAAKAGQIPGTTLPLLEDRVRMRDGEAQIYGSQLTLDAQGAASLLPIEDEAHVDERRARVGLEPLAEYLKRFGLSPTPRSDSDG